MVLSSVEWCMLLKKNRYAYLLGKWVFKARSDQIEKEMKQSLHEGSINFNKSVIWKVMGNAEPEKLKFTTCSLDCKFSVDRGVWPDTNACVFHI